MNIFTQTYLKLINEQNLARILKVLPNNLLIQKANEFSDKLFADLKANIHIDSSMLKGIYEWLEQYFIVGPYNGASMILYIDMDTFFVVDDEPFSVKDKENGFKISIDKEYWNGHKKEWIVVHNFKELFNKNDLWHAVKVISALFNS